MKTLALILALFAVPLGAAPYTAPTWSVARQPYGLPFLSPAAPAPIVEYREIVRTVEVPVYITVYVPGPAQEVAEIVRVLRFRAAVAWVYTAVLYENADFYRGQALAFTEAADRLEGKVP